jgi:biotin-(acetyl-CoA carboxylase) ligase
VNCRLHPANTPYKATNLSAIAGKPVAPARVFARLSATMTHWLDVWAAGADFAAIRVEWLSLAAGLGAWVGVARPSQTVEGTFQTIDATGRLVLEQASGQMAIEAGDVFLSPRPVSSATAGG